MATAALPRLPDSCHTLAPSVHTTAQANGKKLSVLQANFPLNLDNQRLFATKSSPHDAGPSAGMHDDHAALLLQALRRTRPRCLAEPRQCTYVMRTNHALVVIISTAKQERLHYRMQCRAPAMHNTLVAYHAPLVIKTLWAGCCQVVHVLVLQQLLGLFFRVLVDLFEVIPPVSAVHLTASNLSTELVGTNNLTCCVQSCKAKLCSVTTK